MELKPCPFCGEENLCIEEDKRNYWVACYHCFALGPNGETEEDAAEAWNHCCAPPNPPLTLDQLRQMDGEPVWFESLLCMPVHFASQWAIVRKNEDDVLLKNGCILPFVYYGRTWLAYRRRPEEECE